MYAHVISTCTFPIQVYTVGIKKVDITVKVGNSTKSRVDVIYQIHTVIALLLVVRQDKHEIAAPHCRQHSTSLLLGVGSCARLPSDRRSALVRQRGTFTVFSSFGGVGGDGGVGIV